MSLRLNLVSRSFGAFMALVVVSVAGCDGYFAPLDADLEPSTTNNSTPNSSTTNNSTANNSVSRLDWDSASCGGGAACGDGEVCMAGDCGTVLAIDGGDVTTCAVHQQSGATRVMCWGPSLSSVLGRDAGDSRWSFIEQAIDGTREVFHDISVGRLSACVLVSEAVESDRLIVRCWGGGFTGYQGEQEFRESSIALPIGAQSAPRLSVTDLNYCLEGDFTAPFGDDRQAVCWGRFTEESHLPLPADPGECADMQNVSCVDDADIGPDTLNDLRAPGRLSSSVNATCVSAADGLESGVRCFGSLPQIDPFEMVGTLDDEGALDMSSKLFCALVDRKLACRGEGTPLTADFPGDDYAEVRVGHSSSGVCVRTRFADTPGARCLFEGASDPIGVRLLPGAYAMTDDSVCGEDELDGVRQFVCHDLKADSYSWPGFRAQIVTE